MTERLRNSLNGGLKAGRKWKAGLKGSGLLMSGLLLIKAGVTFPCITEYRFF